MSIFNFNNDSFDEELKNLINDLKKEEDFKNLDKEEAIKEVKEIYKTQFKTYKEAVLDAAIESGFTRTEALGLLLIQSYLTCQDTLARQRTEEAQKNLSLLINELIVRLENNK